MIEFGTRRARWLFALGLIAAVIVVYWPALHGGFVWDDDVHISANRTLRSLHGLWEIWAKPGATCQYYPLTFTGFWIEYQLWGLHTFGYHLINVLLHGLAAVLLWQVLAKLKVPGAMLAGAIFALHPVNVMSVAWMTELKNTLSGCLALGMIWAYLHFAGLGALEPPVHQPRSRWRYYALALLLLVLALFAKTASSFLPVTLLLVLWWQRERLNRRDLLPLIPVFGIAVAMGAVTIYVEQHSGGASGSEFQLPIVERILVSGRSFWFYLSKLIFPHRLAFIYERWQVDSHAWWQYLYPLGAAGLLGWLWFDRGRLGKAPFVAAMHFYISTSMLILVVVLFMTRYSFVSDHWQYFGCISVIAFAAAGITTMLNRSPVEILPVGRALVFVVLATLGVLTWRQTKIYADIETLWRATIVENPGSWFPRSNLGAHLLETGRTDEAVSQLQVACELNPAVIEPHHGLAEAFLRMGRFEEAASQARDALKINPEDPEAHANLGTAFLHTGRVIEAINELQKSVEIEPFYVEALSNLGYALSQAGRLNDSLMELQRAVAIDPSYSAARYNLANTLSQLGRPGEALVQFQAALEIDPDDVEAQNNMAWILATSPESEIRNGRKALELARRANELTNNSNPVILATLAAALAEIRNFQDAQKTAEDALQLASESGSRGLVNDIRKQLEAYRSAQPYRDHHEGRDH